jgi:hypothetical protein
LLSGYLTWARQGHHLMQGLPAGMQVVRACRTRSLQAPPELREHGMNLLHQWSVTRTVKSSRGTVRAPWLGS